MTAHTVTRTPSPARRRRLTALVLRLASHVTPTAPQARDEQAAQKTA